MPEPTLVHSTFHLERHYPKPPKAVFAAFANQDKKRKWYAQGERNEVQKFELDFRVGGTETLVYKLKPGTPVAGMTITNAGRYQDIVPEQRIVTAMTMDLNEKRILISQVTVEFAAAGDGTDLVVTNQGIYLDGVNGLTPAMIEAGWRGLLDALQAELAR